MHALVLFCINHHTTFEVPSYTNSKDMIEAKFLKTGHVTLTVAITIQSVIDSLALNIFYMHIQFATAVTEI